MLSILDSTWLDLPRSRSFARRFVLWAPGASFVGKDNDGRQYGCSIHQQAGKRSGSKITCDQYAVEFAGPSPGEMAYSFVFENLEPNPNPAPNEKVGPYLCVVGPNVHRCTCTAGTTKHECCKHRSAALAAIAEGLVDGVEPWDGIHDPGADEPVETAAVDAA